MGWVLNDSVCALLWMQRLEDSGLKTQRCLNP